jgi:hypothetical protein
VSPFDGAPVRVPVPVCVPVPEALGEQDSVWRDLPERFGPWKSVPHEDWTQAKSLMVRVAEMLSKMC